MRAGEVVGVQEDLELVLGQQALVEDEFLDAPARREDFLGDGGGQLVAEVRLRSAMCGQR
ncbi:hypothetical protein GCM10020367_60410 [Streptomyces sannanensis]|uniref:Uncharacterized protein n=1 Tax=Streptomyces sannanensis TaxID=285536 RepID=A0ABP6SKL7_9ACTN